MIEVIPAILPQNFSELDEKMTLMKGAVPLVQIDVCDGKFVPSQSWPYKKHDENFEAILHEERGMPCWEDLEFEMDLMIKEPEREVLQWIAVGASRIIIHIESTENIQKCIDELRDLVEIGLAINVETPIEKLAPFIDQVQFVQCMGIAKIGFQGQPFDERVLGKISELRNSYPELIISVDGGVNLETAPRLVAAGATRLVSGSAIFESDNFVETIEKMESL
jgi:ribulose-phosphate 3-epimerase